MRRIAVLALTLALLLSGCARSPAVAPAPESTAPPSPSPSPTAAPSPTPEPTAAPVLTPSPSPEPRWVRGEESVSYMVLCKNLPQAEALCIWLLGEGKELLAAFGTESLGEPMFTMEFGLDRSGEEPAPAPGGDDPIALTVDQRLLDCGLLRALLPVFERNYGYTVEITSAPAERAAELSREADLAILAFPEAERIRPEGVFYSYWPLASTVYIRED